MGVSENLWSVVKDVKPLFVYDVECKMPRIQWRGNVLHLELIWGTPIYFAFLMCYSVFLLLWQGSWGFSLVPSGKLGFFTSLIRNKELLSMQCSGIGPHLACRGKSHEFSRVDCTRHLVYILELRRGWPFETRVCPAKSGLLSSYDGHLGNLN